MSKRKSLKIHKVLPTRNTRTDRFIKAKQKSFSMSKHGDGHGESVKDVNRKVIKVRSFGIQESGKFFY